MITLENAFLKVSIKEVGAELASIYDKKVGRECLWVGDPAIWKGQSPLLFPVIGSCRNKEYRFEGKTYPMGQHGFAKYKTFAVKELTDEKAVMSIAADEETREVYPFEWELTVTYTLTEGNLAVAFEVINKQSERPMYFSLGAHPGFLFDGELEDQQITFNTNENMDRVLLNTEIWLFSRNVTKDYVKNGEPIAITPHIFDDDALVFHDFKFTKTGIVNKKTGHGVEMELSGFPYIGYWAKPGAPYVCIEPWYGLADFDDFFGELPEKDGILTLEAGKTFNAGYSLKFI